MDKVRKPRWRDLTTRQQTEIGKQLAIKECVKELKTIDWFDRPRAYVATIKGRKDKNPVVYHPRPVARKVNVYCTTEDLVDRYYGRRRNAEEKEARGDVMVNYLLGLYPKRKRSPEKRCDQPEWGASRSESPRNTWKDSSVS